MDAPMPPPHRNNTLSTPTAAAQDKVAEFAHSLGSIITNSQPKSATAKLFSYFDSASISNNQVVLVVPSLDLKDELNKCNNNNDGNDAQNGQKKVGISSIMPKMGQSSNSTSSLTGVGENSNNDDDGETSNDDFDKIELSASVLTSTLHNDPNSGTSSTADSSNKNTFEPKAALALGEETMWTKSTLPYATTAVCNNFATSFAALVDSRVRAWTLLLLRHSLSSGDGESRNRLLRMLSASISVDQIETKFKTIPLPHEVVKQPNDPDVILPLLMEIVLNLSLKEQQETVTIRAPGTISAFLSSSAHQKFERVVVNLDTNVMLRAMVEQARIVVFRAVASITKMPLPQPSSLHGNEPSRSLSGFKSSLGLSSAKSMASLHRGPGNNSLYAHNKDESSNDEPTATLGLQKARSSALRLNSVLHGGGSSAAGISQQNASLSNLTRHISDSSSHGESNPLIRNSSVKFNSPLGIPVMAAPPAKKPRLSASVTAAAKLKSFKSFGRPHASDFGSGPRNATFGEYGSSQPRLWGRDGRLAQHPVPQQEGMNTFARVGSLQNVRKNAIFNNGSRDSAAAAARSSARSLLAGSGGSSSNSAQNNMARSPSTSMPRTATDLENWLMKKST